MIIVEEKRLKMSFEEKRDWISYGKWMISLTPLDVTGKVNFEYIQKEKKRKKIIKKLKEYDSRTKGNTQGSSIMKRFC